MYDVVPILEQHKKLKRKVRITKKVISNVIYSYYG